MIPIRQEKCDYVVTTNQEAHYDDEEFERTNSTRKMISLDIPFRIND